MLISDLIARSLRILRVLDPDEAPEARQYETALVALNGMMRRWEANGIALGWNDILAPGDTLPAPPEAEEAIAFNLALTLRTEYGVQLDPDVIAIAKENLSLLRRDVAIANPLGWSNGNGWDYNVYTDQPGYTRG